MARAATRFTAVGRSLGDLRASIKENGWKLYFDVSPLFQAEWTGIPTVAAGLAQTLLDLPGDDTSFFYRRSMVNTAAVRDALRRQSGLYLERDFYRGHAKAGPILLQTSQEASVGLFPSVKQVASIFRAECSIYHDISTFLLPQFHTNDNIQHHIHGLYNDVSTNLITFGVSQATVDDMVCYLGAAPEKTFVAWNGVSWPWWFAMEARNDGPIETKPYLVVLGTLEPRKNLVLVWKMLEMCPEILDRVRLLVVGRHGWLFEDLEKYPVVQGLVAKGRVRFTGYVSNYQKYRYLRDAVASIYPSLFEGFGLPILESLSVGTPSIVSWSSAMPEVGGRACRYFDPLSVEDLAANVLDALDNPQAVMAPIDIKRAAAFGWNEMMTQILERLDVALQSA